MSPELIEKLKQPSERIDPHALIGVAVHMLETLRETQRLLAKQASDAYETVGRCDRDWQALREHALTSARRAEERVRMLGERIAKLDAMVNEARMIPAGVTDMGGYVRHVLTVLRDDAR